MANAAICFHPDAFDASQTRLLGRHSAGESFLRGFLRHADVERFDFWNLSGKPTAELDVLVERIEPPGKPVRWIPRLGRNALGDPGVLHLPDPKLPHEAWARLPLGARRYAICGVTHTTATDRVMRHLADFLIAPLDDYDALICTSTAVRAAVDAQLDMMREHMRSEYGRRRRAEPQRVTIPLGVNVADFGPSAEHRRAWRERLGIPADGVVGLYVGRFNVRGKMNPALMAMALERAAKRTGRTIYWVNSGWAESEAAQATYHAETAKLCPSVEYRAVDGRAPDARFSIWSVADFFISFSDNIQETFGLTPVEAMAAGLPSVVSDWDGYKDTLRHGIDGFRIPTLAPRPGFGGDIAHWYANSWITYDNYVGAVGQYTAVDLGEAEAAISVLVTDPDLRRRQGEQARLRAREVFDWSVIIPQYQALWAEQNARRRAAPETPSPGTNPYAPDPFALFAAYPTRHLMRDDIVSLIPGVTEQDARARLGAPLAVYSPMNRPTAAEVAQVLAALAEHGPATVARLRELVAPSRANFLERGLLWLARHDIVAISRPS
ncbi:MAG: glycosyltransferase [Phenylobacterium sp.]|uniref:glycosyltransferase family 4 protein n=1 Tax=Phenylobacterium sp. TaxID=1871053 RepID=UPI001207125F|nr:glycosyltransferase family 4 protein [Phenylobacterium sp.]TAJ72192.1 MAG: glycosyltransferase [Phenylobacterium sp.]